MFGDDSFGAQPLSSYYLVIVVSSSNRIRLVLCTGNNQMQLLKQSTAFTVLIGPVLDSTGASYASAVIGDFNITKNGTTAAMAATATATHSHNGMYLIAFTTGNTDTLGMLTVSLNKSTYAMSPGNYEVITSSTFDALVTNAATAAGGLGDMIRVNGQLLSAAGTVTLPGTVASTTNITAGTITTVTTVTNQLTAAQIATGVWQDAVAGDFTTASSIGKALYIANVAPGSSGGHMISGANAGTTTFGALTVTGATTLTGAVSATNVSNSIVGITVSTNSDKTGYSLTQTFPTNFSSFAIDASGRIDIGKILGTASAGTAGYMGLDWGHITAATTTVALTGTTISTTQKVDVDTIKTNAVVNGGTVTFPTNSTLASTTNISAGTVTTATNVTTVNGLAANVITATSIAADAITDAKVASDVTIASVTGSVGSISGVTFPTNFGVLSISATTGLVDMTQTAADKVWSTTSRTVSAATNITSNGSTISQTQLAHLDADISTRMATYTQPSGFLASNFPAQIASPTNITAGTITTTTNLTNLPSIPANWLTAAGLASDAVTEIQTGLSTFDNTTDEVLANVIKLNSNAAAAVLFQMIYSAFPNGIAQDGDTSSITLPNDFSNEDNYYKDQAVFLFAGTGAEQTNRVISYNGTTKVAIVKTPWVVIPDNTTNLALLGRIG